MRFERWFHTLPLRLRSLFRRYKVEQELSEEINYHLENQIQSNIKAGMTPEEARRAAIRTFGGVDQQKEECREARGVSLVQNAIQDLRYGLRMLRKSPGFAFAAIATLALGIGATTAVFSVVYAVALRPLPYRNPERLVGLWTANPNVSPERLLAGVANYRDWREQNTVFEDIALAVARPIEDFNLTGEGDPERLLGATVTASLFRILGIQPIFGRTFTDQEAPPVPPPDGADTVVLSHGLWLRRFGGDPNILGKTIRMNGNAYTVLGVMPETFTYPNPSFELWTPLRVNPREYQTRRGFNYHSIARLKDGISLTQAQTEMSEISVRLENLYPANKGIGARVTPMLDDVVGNVHIQLYLLLGAVMCLLLIGCANLTNLVIVRSFSRRRELVVRSALGAHRTRLMLQSVIELVPLIALGGIGGIFLARWILVFLIPLLPPSIPRVETIRLDSHVLIFAASLLFATAVVSGVWPAVQVMGWSISASLHESSRTVTGGGRSARIRDVLVVTQLAAVVILMVGSALLIRSFVNLKSVDPGFREDNVLSLHLVIPRSKYRGDQEIAQFLKRVLDRVTALPGVQSAGMVNRLPLAGGIQTGSVEFEGTNLSASQLGSFDWRVVTPGYFRTLGIPLLRGRFFEESDIDGRPMVGIIDEQIARRVWPNENPIGKRFRLPYPGGPFSLEIIGVVGHLRHDGLGVDLRPQVYWHYQQLAMDKMALVVRTDRDANLLAGSIVSEIHALDPEQPVYDVRTMNEVVDRSVSQQWLTTALLSLFASVALVLATVGVYGVLSYSVGLRSREIGIRIALGSQRREVIWMILRHGGSLAVVGLAIGLAGSLLLGRLMQTLLYGINATDAVSFAAASILLLLVALVACFVPARRAASLDPLSVLRSD